MDIVKIGNTGVVSTPLGLGTNKVGGHNLFPNLDDDKGAKVVEAALGNGITLLDTAYAYGLGRSEEIIGQVLQKYDRSKVTIATKAAQDPTQNGKLNNSPAFLKQSVDEALKRLKTDYIDIFYIHFPDSSTPKAEAVNALADLKKAGKIRAIGVSNFSLDQIKEGNVDNQIDIIEDNYSLIHRDAETSLFPYLKEHQISFVPYFPLGSGLLTGKYHEATDFPSDDPRQNNPNFSGDRFAGIVQAVNNLQPLADAHDATMAQLILAWYIKNPAISVVIPGARQPEQVLNNAKAMDLTLSDNDYNSIDNAFKSLSN